MAEHPDSNPPEDVPDAVRGFQAGDHAAAEVLARRACRLALRTASAILQSREEAGDIAQDVAVEVLRSGRKLREPAAFDAWVHRVTVRQAMRVLRRRQRSRTTETPLALVTEQDEPAVPEGYDPLALLAARSALAEALAQLPDKQRLALALRYVHDLSDDDIAAALGCRVGTAHALLSRGRTALRHDPRLSHLAPTTAGGTP